MPFDSTPTSAADPMLRQAKKDVTALFNGLLRYRPHQPPVHFGQQQQPPLNYPVVDYLSYPVLERNRRNPPDTFKTLVDNYRVHPEVANNCGTILRESFKHESLARVVLYGDMFWDFFDYVQGGSFDIASDAFSTFRVRALASISGIPWLTGSRSS